jgi:hypothetical protein
MSDENQFKSEYRKAYIDTISSKYKIHKGIITVLAYTAIFIRNFFDDFMLPIMSGIDMGFVWNYYRGKHRHGAKPIFDYFLIYNRFEVMKLKSLFEDDKRFKIVKCPVATLGDECNRLLYPQITSERIISVFPSLLGFGSLNDDKSAIDNWLKAISIISNKFKDYKTYFKLHPRSSANPELPLIKNYISGKIPELIILDNNAIAQEYILRSEVIVSDVSTVLWWSLFVKNKINISIDFNNFFGSNDMKYYEEIHYFNNLEQLRGYTFNTKDHTYGLPGNVKNQQTLTEFLEYLEEDSVMKFAINGRPTPYSSNNVSL